MLSCVPRWMTHLSLTLSHPHNELLTVNHLRVLRASKCDEEQQIAQTDCIGDSKKEFVKKPS